MAGGPVEVNRNSTAPASTELAKLKRVSPKRMTHTRFFVISSFYSSLENPKAEPAVSLVGLPAIYHLLDFL